MKPDATFRWRIVLVHFLALSLFTAIAAGLGSFRTSVTLAWDYPTNEISGITFRVYSSTNISLAVTNWPLYSVVTNAVVGSNTLSTILPIDAQQRWFVMTASNWFGESSFSVVAATPPVPRSDVNLRLGP